jgi:hypothetical protein
LIHVTVLFLVVTSCGGGGGSIGTTSCAASAHTASIFYEVTETGGCTNTLKTNLDFSGDYGYSSGNPGGGDGGGSGSGGGGGGAGASDILIRLAIFLRNTFYELTGMQSANAQAISACGVGVEQSNLNKLTATGWKYLPLVKSTVSTGACVNKIADANNYLAVFATGLSKADKTCYLVMVRKSDGLTHCFSSNSSLKLIDDVAVSGYVDYMTPSMFDSESISMSANKQYFGAVFTDGAGRILFARLTVNSDSSLPSNLVFDSENLDASAPWNTSGVTKNFQRQLLLNNGDVMMHLYKTSSDNNFIFSTQSGYTYISNESSLSAPILVNSSYSNPQCVLQNPDPSHDESFVGVFSLNASGNSPTYDLIKLNSNVYSVIKSNTRACLQLNNAAITRRNTSAGDPAEGRLYYFAPTSYNFSRYKLWVNYVNLNDGSESSATSPPIQVSNPFAVNCNGSSVTDDLADGSIYLLDDQSKFVIATRTTTTFTSSGAISGGGLSTMVIYNADHSFSSTAIAYSDCLTLRKFEKGSSGKFAYATESYGQGQSASLAQTTTTLNAAFASDATTTTVTRSGQNFKLGSVLKPN